jgi:serine/threonine protein phosphatase PrpC
MGDGAFRVHVGNAAATSLAMSRAFGDFYFKQNKELSQREQAICALPEVTVCPRADGAVVVVACDGVWDVMTSQEAVDFVYNALLEEYSDAEYAALHRHAWDPTLLPRVADALLQLCVERNSKDNLSAVVVLLDSPINLLLR